MSSKSGEIFGHPKGLFVLFFTEMWERFSYYGMRALFVLYMTKYLFLEIEKGTQVVGFQSLRSILETILGPLGSQALSSQIYGLYTGFVYLTPFFGGVIADQWLGQRKSIYWGGALMAFGHLLMASEKYFLLALLFLVIGNGFFKPNISTQVSQLYPAGDERRDRAYTIFYMGVNLGAFFSPLICGTLGQNVGWHWGFGAAGVGMLLGLVIYHFGRHHLGTSPREALMEKEAGTHTPEKLSKEDYKRVFALAFVCMLTVMFWGVYEQQGNTLQILADEQTNWNLFGWQMPSTWFQVFNPMLIFILAPVLDRFWGWQSKQNSEPGSVTKMGFGALIMGFGFVLLIVILSYLAPGEKTHWLMLLAVVFFFTVGELYLSPIGLSTVAKVAPVQIVSMMMGVWLMASFFGNILAGYLGSFYEKMNHQSFFTMMVVLSLVCGMGLILFVRPFRKIANVKDI